MISKKYQKIRYNLNVVVAEWRNKKKKSDTVAYGMPFGVMTEKKNTACYYRLNSIRIYRKVCILSTTVVRRRRPSIPEIHMRHTHFQNTYVYNNRTATIYYGVVLILLCATVACANRQNVYPIKKKMTIFW